MRLQLFSFRVVALIGLSVAASGCNQNSSTPDQRAAQASTSRPKPLKYEVKVDAERDTPTQAPAAGEVADTHSGLEPAGSAPAGNSPLPLDDPQAADLTMPRVVLSQAHAQTCLVGVGGTLPDLRLSDLRGASLSLDKLMGPKLTVIMFWNGTQPSAIQELVDLGPDVADRFSAHGVTVVGINVGDDAQSAQELAKTAGARFPILSDPQGAAFAQIANKKIPRTYLVDAAGKIAWLDIEYSRTTRRELTQAIRFLLNRDTGGKPKSP